MIFDHPDSILINEFIEKNTDQTNGFDFLGLLNKFQKTVCQEVAYINVLFPEFTPHNYEHHFVNLFKIADQVLGEELIKKMNIAELFILIASLYGHDWGMAVSEREKEWIQKGELLGPFQDEVPVLLPNEINDFSKFVKKETGNDQVTEELWRDYVRKTHAKRSGARSFSFFTKENPGIAEAVKRTCEGHWLDFNLLRNRSIYPINYSVLNNSVNLCAISVYVRLIDLLDVTYDRTPYVLWKFVSPKNNFSKMEWAKHRALSSVICSNYQGGRVIKIDGKTDDHEVFASLLDLKSWTDEQLRGCNDLLAEMNHAYHTLNIYHIEWNIVTEGFHPTTIRFEFERDRMFQILGDQIYNEDPYVFLRELLQNSIDAIRMRKELLLQKKMSFEGKINININRDNKGDIESIEWMDNGIGMNEYIIKNYFSIAGKSYYSSGEFEKYQLKMDPISRFGIGILSCYTVCSQLEIVTYRDSYIEPKGSIPLKITIPSHKNFFRISILDAEDVEIGTKIIIKMDKQRITEKLGEKPFDVLQYINLVAGFVEFPLFVNDGENMSVIVHPFVDKSEIYQNYGKELSIYQLNTGSLLESRVLAQDVSAAKALLQEDLIIINSDPEMPDFEGVINFQIPNNNLEFIKNGNAIEVFEKSENKRRFRMKDNGYSRNNFLHDISPSCRISSQFAVYKDGILVSTEENPFKYRDSLNYLKPRILVNIKNKSILLNISRTEVLSKETDSWFNNIYKWYSNKILQDIITKLKNKESCEIAHLLAVITFYYNINSVDVVESIPSNLIFLSFIEEGVVKFISQDEVLNNDIFVLQQLKYDQAKMLTHTIYEENSSIYSDNLLMYWNGKRILIGASNFYGLAVPNSITQLLNINNAFLNKNYVKKSVAFLNPPINNNNISPIILERYSKKTTEKIDALDEQEKHLLKSLEFFEELDSGEREQLYRIFEALPLKLRMRNHYGLLRKFEFVAFEGKYDSYLAYGSTMVNVNHPVGNKLVKAYCRFSIALIHRKVTEIKVGQMNDFFGEFSNTTIDFNTFLTEWNGMIHYLKENCYLDCDVIEMNIDESCFIPNTLLKNNLLYDLDEYNFKGSEIIEKFGAE